jgi:predicted RNase H-like HicB family nuclease
MNYPIAIEHAPGKAYGVQVPDLPGCFSAGDTLDEAIANAAEALAFHIEGLLDAGERIPPPQALEIHSTNPGYSGMIWAITSVDLAALSGKSKRLNISLPERVLRRIDAAAGKNGESRSGFIARVALEAV